MHFFGLGIENEKAGKLYKRTFIFLVKKLSF